MTMNDSDNVKMTINIGGEHIGLTVPFTRQEAVREAEKAVAQIYNTWRVKWPSRSDKEVMAMVAYQFASFYIELLERQTKAAEIATLCGDALDDIIAKACP